MVPDVRSGLLDKWGIDAGARVGTFDREQLAFLDYHRVNVFKGAHAAAFSTMLDSGGRGREQLNAEDD